MTNSQLLNSILDICNARHDLRRAYDLQPGTVVRVESLTRKINEAARSARMSADRLARIISVCRVGV